MRRDNGDFLKDLRTEIAASQLRRVNYIRLKLGAIVGIFGLGSARFNSLPTDFLLCLTPLVVFVFDLYITGEDFAIKRAGRFILYNPCVPGEEKRWERTVRENRNPVAPFAHLITSLIFLGIAALYLLHIQAQYPIYYWAWFAFGCAFLLSSWWYEQILVKRLKEVDQYLIEKEKLNHKDAVPPNDGIPGSADKTRDGVTR